MISESTAELLRYPFYKLYHLDDVSSFNGLTEEEVASFKKEYETSLQSDIINSLQWVTAHPAADLTAILPNLLCSNEDLHRFADKVLKSLVS